MLDLPFNIVIFSRAYRSVSLSVKGGTRFVNCLILIIPKIIPTCDTTQDIVTLISKICTDPTPRAPEEYSDSLRDICYRSEGWGS